MSQSSGRTWGCLSAFLLIALLVSFALNLILFSGVAGLSMSGSAASADEAPRFSEQVWEAGADASLKDKVALIHVRGLISSGIRGQLGQTMVDDLRFAFRQASRDENVKAILLSIDSPGGEVTASDELHNVVAEARKTKPVVIWMNSLAASGGYYIACAGSYLMANETTFTGSIGVIIQTLNYQDLLGKVGLDAIVFKSGKFKDMLSGSRPIEEEERAYVQQIVMETYEKFLGIVAADRQLDAAKLREGVADGRVVSGKLALAEGLIDATGHFEDAVAKARELGRSKGAKVVEYRPGFSLSDALRMFTESRAETTVQLRLIDSGQTVSLEPGRMYLLPSFFAP